MEGCPCDGACSSHMQPGVPLLLIILILILLLPTFSEAEQDHDYEQEWNTGCKWLEHAPSHGQPSIPLAAAAPLRYHSPSFHL